MNNFPNFFQPLVCRVSNPFRHHHVGGLKAHASHNRKALCCAHAFCWRRQLETQPGIQPRHAKNEEHIVLAEFWRIQVHTSPLLSSILDMISLLRCWMFGEQKRKAEDDGGYFFFVSTLICSAIRCHTVPKFMVKKWKRILPSSNSASRDNHHIHIPKLTERTYRKWFYCKVAIRCY